MNGELTSDFWYNPVYETSTEGSACYGREGCRQAYLYVLHGGKDVDKAKECNQKAAAVARGNVIEGIITTALLAYLGGAGGGAKPCNSFVPGTEVLMADGTARSIEEVKTGDKILATDPKTGRTTVKTVTAQIPAGVGEAGSAGHRPGRCPGAFP
ncbi:hypothetical protein ACFWN1_21950 [Streptomyces sp. NPDC058459]|uniref:hypothetical protein n=1 Tax=Streptomyces sp. NPDC058459 TaxID=3346508 RepID=UPI003669A796